MFKKNNLTQGTIHAKHRKAYRQHKDEKCIPTPSVVMTKVRPPCKMNHPKGCTLSAHRPASAN